MNHMNPGFEIVAGIIAIVIAIATLGLMIYAFMMTIIDIWHKDI